MSLFNTVFADLRYCSPAHPTPRHRIDPACFTWKRPLTVSTTAYATAFVAPLPRCFHDSKAPPRPFLEAARDEDMSNAKLTKRTVEALAARAKDYITFNTELAGFGVRVMPSGKRFFLVQYRRRGRARRVMIGQV